MGKRGPKPTPTAVLQQRGSWLAKTRHHEPTPARLAAPPPPPSYLEGVAAQVWVAAAPELIDAGIMTALDLNTFGRYCRVFSLWSRVARHLEDADEIEPRTVRTLAKLDESLRHLEAAFGMTPADRVNLKLAPPPAQTADPFRKPPLHLA